MARDVFWLIVVFLFGSVFGSFLNVCIYRLPLGKSLLWPPSHCPKCLQDVGGWNIPILGYFLLKGRCARCGEKFSIQYPAVEFLNASLMAFLYYRLVISGGGTWPLFLICSALTMILVVISFIDIATQIVPRRLSIFGVIVAGLLSLAYPRLHSLYLGFHPGGGQWMDWLSRLVADVPPLDGLVASLAGMIAGALVCLVFRFAGTLAFRWRAVKRLIADAIESVPSGIAREDDGKDRPATGAWLSVRRFLACIGALAEAFVGVRQFPEDGEAMGLGDAWIMAIVGGFLGWRATPMVFLVGAFVGAICGIVSFILNREHKIPYGPYLSVGALIVMLYGNELIRWWVVGVMRFESAPLVLSHVPR